ncbi:hypothetical protein SB5439_04972 [Klebsiella variicola]|uniref:hypothetical protein n=1 Tax=Klebsiella variicola TaxID=244366 RepID=UPI00109C7323|nr:hypothetical protein [Klebsiella variicola]VGQ11608.1 hypothetical protein SB5439_04972 [Klebsiella variicola]
MVETEKHFSGVVTFNEALEFFEHKKAQLDYILRNEITAPKPLPLHPRRGVRYFALKDILAFSSIINAKYVQRKNNTKERQLKEAEIQEERKTSLRRALEPLARTHPDFAELYHNVICNFNDDGVRSKRRTRAIYSIQKYKEHPSANNRFRLFGDVMAYIDSKNKFKK